MTRTGSWLYLWHPQPGRTVGADARSRELQAGGVRAGVSHLSGNGRPPLSPVPSQPELRAHPHLASLSPSLSTPLGLPAPLAPSLFPKAGV